MFLAITPPEEIAKYLIYFNTRYIYEQNDSTTYKALKSDEIVSYFSCKTCEL